MFHAVDDGPGPFLFPQFGPYRVWDDAAYTWMTEDVNRTRRFYAALAEAAPGKTVLDIGTGRDLNWASACIGAGALRAYAIEHMPDAYEQALRTAAERGLEGRVQVILGEAGSLELPEPVDLIVSETIGDIGSGEGAWSVLSDARRFLAPGGAIIPRRCVTHIAALSLPDELHKSPTLGPTGAYYARRVFEDVGHEFDLRLSLGNLSTEHLLSDDGIFEELDFNRPGPRDLQREVTLTMSRSGRLDGFVLWVELFCREVDPVNSLLEVTNWLPAFFPVFYPGIAVRKGDGIVMTCETVVSDDGINPNYRLRGELRGRRGPSRFSYLSEHHGCAFRSNLFYQRVFPL